MTRDREQSAGHPHTDRHVSRICGVMAIVGGALTVVLVLITPDYSRGHNDVVLASCGFAIALGLALVTLAERAPRWLVRTSPLVFTGLIALCTWVAQSPTDGTELLAIWPVLFASYRDRPQCSGLRVGVKRTLPRSGTGNAYPRPRRIGV